MSIITPLPPAPNRTDDPAQFNAKANAFVDALAGLVAELNAAFGGDNLVLPGVPMVGVRLSVTSSQLQTLIDALPADQASELHVRWTSGARMKTGDALYTFIKTTLGFDDAGMTALMANAATFD